MRELVESPDFNAQRTALGDPKRFDELLQALTWGISKRAEDFQVVPGMKEVRMAKTETISWPTKRVPSVRVFFKILNDNQVEMLWIEAVTEAGQ